MNAWLKIAPNRIEIEQKVLCHKKGILQTVSGLYRNEKKCYSAAMTTIKTATFEALLESAIPDGDGYLFTLDGESYQITDTLEITGIATRKGYIIIY
jgi:hypothetical protein